MCSGCRCAAGDLRCRWALVQRRLRWPAVGVSPQVGGKGSRVTSIRLGTGGQLVAWIGIGIWLLVSVGASARRHHLCALSSISGARHQSARPSDTGELFEELFRIDALSRGVLNTILISVFGGAVAVVAHLVIALAGHRWQGFAAMQHSIISVLLPRALPGLVVGLAFFWIFLFVPLLQPIRATILSLLIAYIVVGLSYGLRLIQSTLMQVAPELEEGARTVGATIGQTWRSIVIPIIRPGLLGAWTMIMIIFLREYATGVYLMSAGTR